MHFRAVPIQINLENLTDTRRDTWEDMVKVYKIQRHPEDDRWMQRKKHIAIDKKDKGRQARIDYYITIMNNSFNALNLPQVHCHFIVI